MYSKQNKSKKKLKLEDITYYSSKNLHPFSIQRSKTPKNIINTISSQTPTNKIYNSTASPIKCCNRNLGIMKQAIAQRIQEYKNDYKRKFIRKTLQQARDQTKQKQLKQLRDSPLINKESKKLFEKISGQRNLSPKVLVRFEQYQRGKTLRKLKLRIQTYMNQRNRIPKPQQIISPQKLGDLEQAKKLIDDLQDNIRKFVLRPVKIQE